MALEIEREARSIEDLVTRFKKFLWDFRDKKTGLFKYRDRMNQMALMNQKSLLIDFNDLALFDRELAHLVEQEPDRAIEAASRAVKELLAKEYPEYAESIEKFYPRFRNPTRILRIRELTSEYIGKLVAVEGIVTRLTKVEAKLVKAKYRHVDPECQAEFDYPESGEMGEKLEKPPFCPICGKTGKFELLLNRSQFIDWQKVVIQEKPEEIPPGQIPRNIEVVLTGDLVDTARPGDRVTVIGVLRVMPTTSAQRGTGRSVFAFYVEANYVDVQQKILEEVEITREDEEKIRELARDPWIREKIIASIAPAIYGYWNIKEAIALLLFSGTPKLLPDGTRIRGDIHVLLVGDPGTAKSQLLQYTARIAPRGIYTSGKGSTAAGLTASVLRDKSTGEYYLEAGALVLADGGVACLHPDTRVLVGNEYVRISDLFDENRAVKALSGGEPVELCSLGCRTVGIDLGRLSAREALATIVRRKMWRGKLLKLVFESGHELVVTPDHLLISGDTLEWKPASEFKPGDTILSLQRIPGHADAVYVVDAVPDSWVAVLEGRDREELSRILVRMPKETLLSIDSEHGGVWVHDGKLYIRMGLLKQLLRSRGYYSEWKARIQRYIDDTGVEVSPKPVVTPELGYILGVVYASGKLLDSGEVVVSIPLGESFLADRIAEYLEISGILSRSSRIQVSRASDEYLSMAISSPLLVQLVMFFFEDGLKRILKLPDEALKAFIAGLVDAGASLATSGSELVISILVGSVSEAEALSLALKRFDIYSGINRVEQGYSVEIMGLYALRLIEAIKQYSFRATSIAGTGRGGSVESSSSYGVEALIPRKLSEKIAVGLSAIFRGRTGWRKPLSKYQLKKLVENVGLERVPKSVRELVEIAVSEDYYLDRIVRIEHVEYSGPVYDLYVPSLHSFVANGIVVHNCIDEIDKMREDDRSAIHEALEQQTVSIAKAGIVARLNARASVLAAGNPKYGRYDLREPISRNIDLPPTILSRFDLIFVIQDIPDRNRDRLLARHILGVHVDTEKAKPIIDAQLLKKYVSYARRYIRPRLTEEAKKLLEEFYVTTRLAGLSTDEESRPTAIPITPRQLEALIRLAEAHAKMALKTKATVEDAEEAIRLMYYTLRKIGYDIESHTLDIDLLELGMPRSKQVRVKDFIKFIDSLFEEYDEITYNDLVRRASEKGFDKEFVVEMIRKLKREGVIYEPKPGVLSKT